MTKEGVQNLAIADSDEESAGNQGDDDNGRGKHNSH